MTIRHVTPGASLPAPAGALRIRLDGPPGARLELRAAEREIAPQVRTSDVEVVLVPTGRDVVLTAVALDGKPFPPGFLVGVTITTPSGTAPGGADAVVKLPVDAGGRAGIGLVRVSGALPAAMIHDLVDTAEALGAAPAPRPWHRAGAYAWHAHHDGPASPRHRWAVVIDMSAAMLVGRPRAAVGTLVEHLVGIGVAAQGSAPECVVACDFPVVRDIGAGLDRDTPDWSTLLGDRPSPWSRITAGVRAAAEAVGDDGVVVLLTDGVPVDVADLAGWFTGATTGLAHVALGRSRYEIRPDHRPTRWWDDELDALAPLDVSGRGRVLGIGDLGAVPAAAVDLADALFATSGVAG